MFRRLSIMIVVALLAALVVGSPVAAGGGSTQRIEDFGSVLAVRFDADFPLGSLIPARRRSVPVDVGILVVGDRCAGVRGQLLLRRHTVRRGPRHVDLSGRSADLRVANERWPDRRPPSF
jgi:hypothetical protein